MKVIDLLNKIANGEEVPKKVKYDGIIFHVEKSVENLDYYESDRFLPLLQHYIITVGDLIKEVEIIEEEQDIEEISNEHNFYCYSQYEEYKNEIDKVLYIIKAINSVNDRLSNTNNKINELIKAVNELKKNER